MSADQPKYKAVIFDFDDTLVKSHVLKWAHHKEAAKRFYNLDITDEDIRKEWGKPFPVLVRNTYGNVGSVESIVKNIRSLDNEFLKEIQEDAPDILTRFLDTGIKISIVSAADAKYVNEDLLRLGFPLERFFMVQGCDDTNVHKPDPRVFDHMLEKFASIGIEKKDIVYVGDSVDDSEAAQGAGIDFIGIATGIFNADELKKKGAPIVLSHIRELPGHILI